MTAPHQSTTSPPTTLVVAVPIADNHFDRLRRRFPGLTVVTTTPDTLERELAAADAFVTWDITREQLAVAGSLRWLQIAGAGVDGLPLAALAERGVVVTNYSGVHAINIGEHVLAMMLAFARQLPALVRAQQRREWRDAATRERVFELHGQHLVVVGLGEIGLAVAERAVAFGMTVSGVRRRPDLLPPAGFAAVVGLDGMDDLLAVADHVALCLPLTPNTRGLFDAARLARIRPGAYLFNIGRGPVVATEALVGALRSGHLAGAGLDVTDPEPLPPTSPLWEMENVLLTAHTSGGTPRYWERGLDLLEANVERFLAGAPLLNVVDPAEGY
jgi:phosphoglycerate dehydrogenase-like enzyme